MRPRERRESDEQDPFRSRLDRIINTDDAQVKLARTIDWREIRRRLQGWPRPAAVADAADGGACDSQTHLQP
jgi:hypothetical protein